MEKSETLVIYNYIKRKASWLKRKRRIVSFIAQVTAWRKCLLKAKLLLLKELLIRENKPKTKRVRSCRRHLRNTGWWETVNSEYSDETSKQTFRVSRETFNFLLSKIENDMTKKETAEIPISASKRLAVCLHNFAREDHYYTIQGWQQQRGGGASLFSELKK